MCNLGLHHSTYDLYIFGYARLRTSMKLMRSEERVANFTESRLCGQVAILMCTYNGASYLQEQLDSIYAQEYRNWYLYVSDDGSQDSTQDILHAFKIRIGQLHIFQGPRNGSCQNFLSLIRDSSIKADYYALSDQDDIWYEDKLARAVKALSGIPCGTPALYCSRTRLVDEKGTDIGLSPLFKRTPSFQNALVQNIGSGNTMLLNHAARQLMMRVDPNNNPVVHDWFLYMVVSGCGGIVIYDPIPSLGYRQHAANLIGANAGFIARLKRFGLMLFGTHRRWNTHNIEALSSLREKLTPGNRFIYDEFSCFRNASLWNRLAGLYRTGLYRQTFGGNVSLWLAALFKRL